MKLSEFKFDFPEEQLIALHPANERDESRLMVVHRDSGEIEHRLFKDIIEYFDEGDVLVANDTKVFPARLYGSKEKTGAQIEVFLLRELKPDIHLWDVLVDPARKIRVGNKLFFGDGELVAEVIDNTTSRGRTIRFIYNDEEEDEIFYDVVDRLGYTPLPDYIYKKRKTTAEDRERFQTIFAENVGAVSAPTAGLHFTKQLVKKLEIKGVDIATLTLHIGLGTFRKVEVEDLTKHKADSENYAIKEKTVEMVNTALSQKKKVCAVGTTVLKALEASVSAKNLLKSSKGWSDKFIFAPYEFRIPTTMITNFHFPESTLLMTTSAFGGHELIMGAYQVAMKEKYKFGAYGDAMLVL